LPPSSAVPEDSVAESRRILLALGAGSESRGQAESLLTVLVAIGVNVLLAVAKSIAAVVTGSASMLAEAAHSWATRATTSS
jgi:hypothetical protein